MTDTKTDVSLVAAPDRPTNVAPIAERSRVYADQEKAPNTVRAYRADWRDACPRGEFAL